MPQKVVIIGAGGHGKVIADIVLASGDILVGYLDDDPNKTECYGFPVLGNLSHANKLLDCSFVLGIGDNLTRERISKIIDLHWYTAIHPSAMISSSVSIGVGTVIMSGVIINADSSIGSHCIINSGAVIEHDSKLNSFVHISPLAALGGNTIIGASTHIGIGACVKNNISICDKCVIGAGTVVIKNIDLPGVYVGTPALRLR